MICFNCDYTEGAHESIMDMMMKTNLEQTVGYGEDKYSEKARELIKKECKRDDIDVHFLVGGTQANLTVISSILRPWQGVAAVKTGHINVHETGAVEATGHKVLALECGKDGKMDPKLLDEYVCSHFADETHEHMVQPGMVYISDSTENGGVYTKKELTAISEICRKHKLPLFMDGARLGYALASRKNDMSLNDICSLCDVFYIGGTKVGALFGEAVVICNPELKKDFRYMIKQKGGMLAKGRLLGIQFLKLFEDGLYYNISSHAAKLAERIADSLKALGIEFYTEPESNQIFPILSDRVIEKLSEKYLTAFWAKTDDSHSAIRICTSWATEEENVCSLIEDIKACVKEQN